MVLGDPYKFSICFDVITQWNTDCTFLNGVLFLCINGDIYPKEILTATLKLEIQALKQRLSDIAFDTELYHMPKEEAFKKMYNITYPENIDVGNDYRFDISPSIFADNNCFLFAISDGANVRVLASKLNYVKENSRHNLLDIIVNEAILSIEEVNELILGLKLS